MFAGELLMNKMLKTRRQNPVHGPERTRAGETFSPRVDIVETDDEFVFFADVPGVDGADVDLRFVRGELTLRARVEARNSGDRLSHVEYGVGDVFRSFKIGPYIDASRITAKLSEGVLKIRCPKCQLVDGQQIEVKST